MKAILLALSIAAVVPACMLGGDDKDQSPTITVDGTDRIAVNSLLPGDITASSLGNAALTSSAISGTAQTSSGRSFLSYLVDCALTSSQSISVQVGLTNYTFTGSMGMQPNWTTGALSVTDQKMISSCVLARANYYGTAVSISLRGPNNGYRATTDELNNYKIEEGAFYGNILGGGSAIMHACVGRDQAHDPTQGDLPKRKCAAGQSWCNFVNDGLCSSVCTWNATNGYYTGCGGIGYDGATIMLYGLPD